MNGYKCYCSRCGWNHEIVRGELSSAIKVSLFLVTLGVIFAVVVRMRNPSEGWAWVVILLAFSPLPLFYALSALHQARKLRNLSFQPANHKTGAFTISEMGSSSDVPSVFKEKEFPELVALPRPRKLKMTWKGRRYGAFALVWLACTRFTASQPYGANSAIRSLLIGCSSRRWRSFTGTPSHSFATDSAKDKFWRMES